MTRGLAELGHSLNTFRCKIWNIIEDKSIFHILEQYLQDLVRVYFNVFVNYIYIYHIASRYYHDYDYCDEMCIDST